MFLSIVGFRNGRCFASGLNSHSAMYGAIFLSTKTLDFTCFPCRNNSALIADWPLPVLRLGGSPGLDAPGSSDVSTAEAPTSETSPINSLRVLARSAAFSAFRCILWRSSFFFLRAWIALRAPRSALLVFFLLAFVNLLTARTVFFVLLASVRLALFVLTLVCWIVFRVVFAIRLAAFRRPDNNFFDAFRTLLTAFALSFEYAVFLRRFMSRPAHFADVFGLTVFFSRIADPLPFSPTL